MGSGFNSPSANVRTVFDRNPFTGHAYVFRGRRGNLIKLQWWTGIGMYLLMKRLARGSFVSSGCCQHKLGDVVRAVGRYRLTAAGAHSSADLGVASPTGVLIAGITTASSYSDDNEALMPLLLKRDARIGHLEDTIESHKAATATDKQRSKISMLFAQPCRTQFGRR